MIANYFKLAFRNLRKHKTHSFIMIGGFAIGIAACVLISLFIRNELSFDKHTPKSDQIYRFFIEYNYQGKTLKGSSFPSPFAQALKDEFSEVESTGKYVATRLFGAGDLYFKKNGQDERHFENGFVWADQGFIDTLSIEIIAGDPRKVLVDPRTVVISRKMAEKYYPYENPIGKSIVINNDEQNPFQIKGVMEDFPATSHLDFQFLMSYAEAPFGVRETTWWMQSNHTTYARFKQKVDVKQFEKKLEHIVTKYYKPAALESNNGIADDIHNIFTLKMQPLGDVYLASGEIQENGPIRKGDIRFVWLFGIVAVIILLIACVNFVNLSTARSAKRAKEVGLRKVVGSTKESLIYQFLGESMLICFISFMIGIVLCELFLPWFNSLSGKSLAIPWDAWSFYLIVFLSVIIVGLFAGVFPACYLSSFTPVSVLKGRVTLSGKSSGLRSFLVIFQFTVCIALIIGTSFVFRQLDYILNRSIGFEKDQVLIIEGTDALGNQGNSFRETIVKQTGVLNASYSDYIPVAEGTRNGNGWYKEGRINSDPSTPGQLWVVDEEYINTLGMNILEGRDFSRERRDNQNAAIINESMVKQLGLSEPVGARITNSFQNFTVIGVVEDFQYESAQFAIMPVCLAIGNSRRMLIVKVDGLKLKQTISSIKTVWSEFSPNQAIRINYLDESYARMYSDVQRLVSVLGSFAILAIVVASLGLFALSAFMTEQRYKEISIRRVLGASTEGIFKLLSISFLRLVVISFLIAAPLAWYVLQQWLNSYSYRINLTWDVFITSGILASLIAVGTISYHTIRAANRDPAKGLRSE